MSSKPGACSGLKRGAERLRNVAQMLQACFYFTALLNFLRFGENLRYFPLALFFVIITFRSAKTKSYETNAPAWMIHTPLLPTLGW